MQGLQEMAGLAEGMVMGAMILPIVASVVLGVICAIWNAFN